MQGSFSFGPVFGQNSKILILGSFPSMQSRAVGFYYADPQNRFWHVLVAVYQEAVPETVEEKRALLFSHGLALWNVLERYEIRGSDNANMRGTAPVDIEMVTRKTKICRVLVNNTTTAEYYAHYLEAKTNIPAVRPPSTGPASAGYRLERLMEPWGAVLLRKEG